MHAIDAVGAATGTTESGTPIGAPSATSLARQDVFLRLLVAQLANQDPLDPASGTEWISQLAEFSSLEQLNDIRDGIDKLLQKLS